MEKMLELRKLAADIREDAEVMNDPRPFYRYASRIDALLADAGGEPLAEREQIAAIREHFADIERECKDWRERALAAEHAILNDPVAPPAPEGASECPYKAKHNIGFRCPACGVIEQRNTNPFAPTAESEAAPPKVGLFGIDRDLCRLSIVSTWPTKGGFIVKEYPDRVIDRIMGIVDKYVSDERQRAIAAKLESQ